MTGRAAACSQCQSEYSRIACGGTSSTGSHLRVEDWPGTVPTGNGNGRTLSVSIWSCSCTASLAMPTLVTGFR